MVERRWDRWSASVRDRERSRLLRAWLHDEVLPFSPFWAERFGDLTIAQVADLGQVPVADEDELAPAGGPGNPALLVLPTEEQLRRRLGRRRLRAAMREVGLRGEDGRRLVLYRRYKPVHVHEAGVARLLTVAYTRTDLDRLHLAGARLMEVLGLGADDTVVNGVPGAPSVLFWGLYHALLANRMAAVHALLAARPAVQALAQAVAVLPPSVLVLPTADAKDLLEGLAEERVSAPYLRTVVVVGPPPDADERIGVAGAAAALGAVDDVRVQAVWAPSASRALWAECRPAPDAPAEAAYGLHTYPDLEVLEVRDLGRGTVAAAGTSGELLYTSLGWRGTVLVRAATGAWTGGVVAEEACPNCGRTVPRLSSQVVEAAWQRQLSSENGPVHVDLRPVPAALDHERLAALGVRNWSLQVRDGSLVLGLDADREHRREALAEFARAIDDLVGVVPEVQLGAVPASVRPQVGAAGPPPGRWPPATLGG